MNINLISIGSHGKNLALFQQFTKEGTILIKEAYHEKSNQIIEREYQGYKWYFRNIIKRDNPIRIKRNNFYQLILPQFPGIKFSSERKFHKYRDVMLKIVRFYKKNWPIDENFTIHGDMALSNFIINNDEIYLIDWEHFHNSSLEYYGFDIINMLFISFYYRLSKSGYVNSTSKQFIRECFRLLFNDISFKNSIIDRPFYNSKLYLVNNYVKYSYDNFDLKRKFMLARFSDEALNKLDYFITK